MRQVLFSLAAAAALAAGALPASAQFRTEAVYVASFDQKIGAAAQQGRISADQARDLQRQLDQVKAIAAREATSTISAAERQVVHSTITHIQAVLSGRVEG